MGKIRHDDKNGKLWYDKRERRGTAICPRRSGPGTPEGEKNGIRFLPYIVILKKGAA